MQAVAGVDHVLSLAMKRYDAPTPGTPDAGGLEVRFDEIVLVENDPDHMERGTISFDAVSGRARSDGRDCRPRSVSDDFRVPAAAGRTGPALPRIGYRIAGVSRDAGVPDPRSIDREVALSRVDAPRPRRPGDRAAARAPPSSATS